ncbi:MAG: hypothetical protein HRT57_04965 [Crocinitomicaceae bacterium]|nr:hypothetical protein [Crocinitomicaceae bacterium]
MKNQLTKIVTIAFIPVALMGCSENETSLEKDDQFCKCLEVTGDLNEYSSKMFDKKRTIEDAQKMKSLRKAKTKACEDYQVMSGKEMSKRKALCKKDS